MTTFRLAGVLRMRRTLEEQCEVRAAAAHRRAIAAEGIAVARHDELRRSSVTPGAAHAFAASVTSVGLRAASARDADARAVTARDDHRSRIDELVAASMAVSALERLEERVADARREAERTREMREIDDLVTARFARRGSDQGDAP